MNFVTFDLPFQYDRRGPIDNLLAVLLDHGPGIVRVDVKVLGNLQSRLVQPDEVEAGDPGPQRQVVAGEDGYGQVVEPLAAASTLVALLRGLGLTPAVLDDRARRTFGAGHAVGSSHISGRVETLGVVEEILDIDRRATPRGVDVGIIGADGSSDRRDRL